MTQVRRNRLPKIKVLNKKSVNELVVSLKEAETNRRLIEKAGPSPGVFSLASMRCQLRQSPRNHVSFKRVGIR